MELMPSAAPNKISQLDFFIYSAKHYPVMSALMIISFLYVLPALFLLIYSVKCNKQEIHLDCWPGKIRFYSHAGIRHKWICLVSEIYFPKLLAQLCVYLNRRDQTMKEYEFVELSWARWEEGLKKTTSKSSMIMRKEAGDSFRFSLPV